MAKKLGFLKFFALALGLFTAPVLAACDLVTINYDKQLNQVVSSFDNGRVELTREQLIIMYNSTGRSRFDSSGTATKEGIESTIELALDRLILVDMLTSDDQADLRDSLGVKKVVLNNTEIHDIWWGVYDYLNSSILEYENQLRKEDGLESWSEESEEEETDSTIYTPYEKTYEVQSVVRDGKIEYRLVKLPEKVDAEKQPDALFDVNDKDLSFSDKAKQAYTNFRQKYWNQHDSMDLYDTVDKTKTSYSDKAWNKFIQNLLVNESKRNLSKNVEEVFLREVQRVYDIYYQNAVLSQFQNNYTQSLAVTADDVVNKFLELYNAQKEQFTVNPAAFDSMIPTKAEGVYYVANPNYFKVNHILVKFSDEQTKAMEALKTDLENGKITVTEYNQGVANIKSQTKAYNRDTQEYEPYTQVLQTLNEAMKSATTLQDKFVIFREFMHRYSEDTATLNADACYYIPTVKTDPVTGKSNDTMEENFADTSRELYESGEVGKYSDFAETSYGYHIILYSGDIESIAVDESVTNILLALDGYKLNPLYNKTMLDVVIGKVVLTSFSKYEDNILDRIKADKDIINYPKAYDDLYS